MQDLKSKSARQVNSKFLARYPLGQPGQKEKQRGIMILTNREKGVLALAGRGLTNQDIAEKLGISSRTVKCILHHACLKMRAPNRTQALFMAVRKGHISIKEVLSLDELAELLASLDPEAIDSVNQRLKLKDKKHNPLLDTEFTRHTDNRRLAVAAK
jgi:DNA-binding CsgD family transcriptional regulator